MISVIVFVCAVTNPNCSLPQSIWSQKVLGSGSMTEACATGQEVARNRGIPGQVKCIRAPIKRG
jgi:hypothetical protein